MNFIRVVSFLSLLLLAAAAAKKPEPCESPPLMSGSHTLMVGEGMMATGTIAYDASEQKVRIRQTLVGDGASSMDALLLYSENLYYMIDWTMLTCSKRRLSGGLFSRVPKDAKVLVQVNLGSSFSGTGMKVNNWHGSLPGNGSYSYVFTDDGCIPLTFTTYSPTSGWVTLSTSNWVTDVPNPSVFLPPSICGTAQVEEAEKSHSFVDALTSMAHDSLPAE